MIYKLFVFFFILFFNFSINAEQNIDQWIDSKKTYYDLIQEGFEVKEYSINSIDLDSGYILMFFVTVLQKDNQVCPY